MRVRRMNCPTAVTRGSPGLAHLGTDTGRASELIDSTTSYEIGRSANLESAPRTVVVEQGGSVLVVTMDGLLRLGTDFRVQYLLRTHWGMFYPVSCALDAGVLYVGMRGIVVEVQLGSKGALETMTIGLAREVAEEGIRVNAVRPGFIYTDMHAAGGDPNRVDRLKDIVPLKRGGTPVEVARAILWLLSDDASYSTGTFIDVAGGK